MANKSIRRSGLMHPNNWKVLVWVCHVAFAHAWSHGGLSNEAQILMEGVSPSFLLKSQITYNWRACELHMPFNDTAWGCFFSLFWLKYTWHAHDGFQHNWHISGWLALISEEFPTVKTPPQWLGKKKMILITSSIIIMNCWLVYS